MSPPFFVLVLLLRLSGQALPQDEQISSGPSTSYRSSNEVLADSCKMPATSSSSSSVVYCSEVVNYTVPSPIARIAEFLDHEVMGTVEAIEDASSVCKDVLKETYCKRKFPRCSSDQVLFEIPHNCAERLEDSCGDLGRSLINDNFCATEVQAPLRSGECRPLTSYDTKGSLQYCGRLEQSLHVSEWMYQYILQVDVELDREILLTSPTMCWERYQNFFCSAVGNCTGENVEQVNTVERCKSIPQW